ncbi:hypothetical protein DFH06DRAFT_1228154 [Mycena polygramma]|nr:hypothetical protein DFH06DRAFT_1228154 [Mycena polygramma]
MPPTPEQTQNDSGSVLPPFTADCSNNSRVPICTIAFVFLLLAFYALALWDRWLNLKMRESQKLRTQTPMYGATQECSTRPPSINIIPAPPNTGLNNKLSRNQNDSKTQSQLPLPSIVLDEDST